MFVQGQMVSDSNTYIGSVQTIAIPSVSNAGWYRSMAGVTELELNPPAKTGFTLVGFLFPATSTYKIRAPYSYTASGKWYLDVYVEPNVNNGNASYRPIYVRN